MSDRTVGRSISLSRVLWKAFEVDCRKPAAERSVASGSGRGGGDGVDRDEPGFLAHDLSRTLEHRHTGTPSPEQLPTRGWAGVCEGATGVG